MYARLYLWRGALYVHVATWALVVDPRPAAWCLPHRQRYGPTLEYVAGPVRLIHYDRL